MSSLLAVSPSTFSWSIHKGNSCRVLFFLAIFPAGVASGPKKGRLCFHISRAGSFPLTYELCFASSLIQLELLLQCFSYLQEGPPEGAHLPPLGEGYYIVYVLNLPVCNRLSNFWGEKIFTTGSIG